MTQNLDFYISSDEEDEGNAVISVLVRCSDGADRLRPLIVSKLQDFVKSLDGVELQLLHQTETPARPNEERNAA